MATGRFIDRDKLHYIDFEGRWFSVKGPSINPRPPQGSRSSPPRPRQRAVPVIARSADIGFVTPRDAAHAAEIVAQIRAEQAPAGRPEQASTGQTVHVFGDLVVFLDETKAAAVARRERLDERAGTEYRSDARIFTGTAIGLADLLQEWQAAGLSGFRLRPAALPHDLTQITDRLVPELRRRCLFRARYEADTLRGLLGLGRPASRYAAA